MSKKLLRRADVVERTGMPSTTMYREIRLGRFPRGRKLTENTVGWVEAEVDAWIESREATQPASASV